MSLDSGPLGQKVAEFMEDMEREYGEDAELVAALVVVEISHPDEGGERSSDYEARTLDDRVTTGIGLAVQAIDAMR